MNEGWVLYRKQVNSASYPKNSEHFNIQYSAQYNELYSVQYSVNCSMM